MPEFTTKQIYDLNNMNVAAQNIQLGTVLNSLVGGGSAGTEIIEYPYTELETQEQKNAFCEMLKDRITNGAMPVLRYDNIDHAQYYVLQQVIISYNQSTGQYDIISDISYATFYVAVSNEDISYIEARALEFTLNNGNWIINEGGATIYSGK